MTLLDEFMERERAQKRKAARESEAFHLAALADALDKAAFHLAAIAAAQATARPVNAEAAQ